MIKANGIIYNGTDATRLYYGNTLIWEKNQQGDYDGYDIVLEWDTREEYQTSGSGISYSTHSISINGNRTTTNYTLGNCYLFPYLEEEPSTITKCKWSDIESSFRLENKTYVLRPFRRYVKNSGNTYNWENSNLVKILKIDTSYIAFGLRELFAGCQALTYVNLTDWDENSKPQMSIGNCEKCTSLTTIVGSNIYIINSINVSESPLTNDSAMVLINGLAEVTTTKKLQFKSDTYSTLTQEQIALATSKGWTIIDAI